MLCCCALFRAANQDHVASHPLCRRMPLTLVPGVAWMDVKSQHRRVGCRMMSPRCGSLHWSTNHCVGGCVLREALLQRTAARDPRPDSCWDVRQVHAYGFDQPASSARHGRLVCMGFEDDVKGKAGNCCPGGGWGTAHYSVLLPDALEGIGRSTAEGDRCRCCSGGQPA